VVEAEEQDLVEQLENPHATSRGCEHGARRHI